MDRADGPDLPADPRGEFVAEQFAALRDAMATERELRDVSRWLPREMEGFTVDLFADADDAMELEYRPVTATVA